MPSEVCAQQSSGPAASLTQDGHDHIVAQDLDGSAGDEVERGEHIAEVHQRVPRRCMSRLELDGQRAQAALAGASEGWAVLQQRTVQMQADVGLQALGKALEHLREAKEGGSGAMGEG